MNVTIGTSQKLDSFAAAKELTEKIAKPSDVRAILLFATIQYGEPGLRTLVKGVRQQFPEQTMLLGGTVAGFCAENGIYTRGCAAMFLAGDDFETSAAIGQHTKRGPKTAVEQLVKAIPPFKKEWKNKIVFEFVSGPTVPKAPLVRPLRTLKNRLVAKLLAKLSTIINKGIEEGVGREEEALAELAKNFPSSNIIGGSNLDNNQLRNNYQFFGSELFRNSIVALILGTSLEPTTETTYGVTARPQKFKVTKLHGAGRIVSELDGEPASKKFMESIGWEPNDLDERLYRRTFHVTLGYEKNGMLFPEVIGAIYGDDLWLGYGIESKELVLMTASGDRLKNCVEENLQKHGNRREQMAFGFLVICASMLETLGDKNEKINDRFKTFFGSRPYLGVYLGGEDTHTPNIGTRHVNYSFNSLLLLRPN